MTLLRQQCRHPCCFDFHKPIFFLLPHVGFHVPKVNLHHPMVFLQQISFTLFHLLLYFPLNRFLPEDGLSPCNIVMYLYIAVDLLAMCCFEKFENQSRSPAGWTHSSTHPVMIVMLNCSHTLHKTSPPYPILIPCHLHELRSQSHANVSHRVPAATVSVFCDVVQ
jgi:hypothetical protein